MGNVDLHHRALGEFKRILDGVTDEQLSSPTPCTEWDVRALVEHVTGGNWFFASLARGDEPTAPPAGEDVHATFDRTAAAASEAFAGEGVTERIFDLPFGKLPGEIAIGIHATDVVTHAWDLAKATGQEARIPDDLVDPLLQLVRLFPETPELRSGPFGPKVECSDSAPLLDQLVAHLGRQP